MGVGRGIREGVREGLSLIGSRAEREWGEVTNQFSTAYLINQVLTPIFDSQVFIDK